jgi:hypothetical protein
MTRFVYRQLYYLLDLYQAPATLPAVTMLGFGVYLLVAQPFSRDFTTMAEVGNEWVWGIVIIVISVFRLTLYRLYHIQSNIRAINTGLSALLWFVITVATVIDHPFSLGSWMAINYLLVVLVDFLRWTGWVEYLEDRVQNG